jgi:hypothetical protein
MKNVIIISLLVINIISITVNFYQWAPSSTYSFLQLLSPAIAGTIGPVVAFVLAFFLFELKDNREKEVQLKRMREYYVPALITEYKMHIKNIERSNIKILAYINRINKTDEPTTKCIKCSELEGYCSLIVQSYSLDKFIILKKIYENPSLLEEKIWENVIELYNLMSQFSFEFVHSTTNYIEFEDENLVEDDEWEENIIENAEKLIEGNKKICDYIRESIIPVLDKSLITK